MNDAKVSEMSVEQKEYHYRRTASSLEHEVERLRDINKDLLAALREAKDVLFLVKDGKVAERETMVSNAIAIADGALRKAEGK